MHELAVTEYVFDLVKKQAEENGAKRVIKIHLMMGDMCDYVPQIIEEYLQLMSEGTPLFGAKVSADIIESVVECKDCGANFTRREFNNNCPKCGSANLRLRRCTDFIVKNIEIE